ncbi:adenosylmethionine-8-amino-7-oxononanoate aminotransferase [Gordonia hirsuta DSM 44140 = NBRC 16056]|uniref:Adenosylmethionine-8-amino-7-oxononanoate aminotransferase n=1 Tax=Gordonia hirsuta DSM 44140 = NBRC 16056 TaxID=1121927 RepID=L7L7B1_9ACTN|nr:adenosylmethionine--8-amino-7-oxononanoate transaminase [Gordonia hirsuta]GAC55913.1 adenosylmethionine-8-amino-7-oxononanoate aminotransferase [Gordonia hirsuta DSM 44140 = NBRC 16056]
MEAAEISRIDAAHVWHPYGGFPSSTTPRVVTACRGVRLTLADGTELIDGMSSWWAAVHGYAHPVLDAAVREQLGAMAHVMFGGLTHEPAAALAALLVELTPEPLSKVFFADSGSVSVEVAVKMAVQYQRSRGRPAKHRLLTWRGGYHGDTLAPMSVCDPDGGMHAMWRGVLPEQVFVEAPPPVDCAHGEAAAYVRMLETVLADRHGELAAVIVEPVVQGAGGMRFHPPQLIADLRRLCDTYDVLLICDEIATGFGRTGELFAVDHAGISPDILCVGKALTGGYLTLAATITTDEIAAVISAGEAGGLAHGPTFMANPLACAVARASLGLLADGAWRAQVAMIGRRLERGLAPLRAVAGIAQVRSFGAIGVIELDRPVDMVAATDAAAAGGVWLRPFGDLIYAMPPYICTPAEVDAIAAAMGAAARASLAADRATGRVSA